MIGFADMGQSAVGYSGDDQSGAGQSNMAESERHLRNVLAALPVAVYTTDTEGRITSYNQAAVDLWGREPTLGVDKWCGSHRLYRTDGTPLRHDQCPMVQAIKENRPIRGIEALAERPDGTRVAFAPHPTPLHDETGAVIGAVNMLTDLSNRRRAEARQKQLNDELNHRVKNTLATVQSIASQMFRSEGGIEETREAFEGRLLALSRVHDQLADACWVGADLASIVESIAEAHRLYGAGQILFGGDAIRLPPQTAVVLSMVLHELATNAVAHGALSRKGGTADIRWDVVTDGGLRRLQMIWQEAGGPPVVIPQRAGFGTRLVDRAVRRELNGAAEFAYDSGGVRCRIEIPLLQS